MKNDKRIMWDMLSTKPWDRNYLRNRRTYIIKYLSSAYRGIDEVLTHFLHINHKYLVLIDLGFDVNSDREYELQTADLLTGELDFNGSRLGDTRKPDICVYYDENGIIIDNKAYGKGYSLPIKQADEMIRYIEENQKRDRNLNSNE